MTFTAEQMAEQTGWPAEAWKAAEAELGPFWWPALQAEIAQVVKISGTSPDGVARAMTLPDAPDDTPPSQPGS